MNVARLFSLVFALSILASCATSPTGRSQLLLMPKSEMDQMGIAAFTDMKKQGKVDSDPRSNRYVRCVADAVTSALPAKDQQQWEVVVFKDDTANAFALPGGKIGVNTGLLKVATNQAQLATVIGHEVGHVLAQHGNARMSLQYATQTGTQLLGAMIGDSAEKPAIMAALGVGVQYGVQLPFSRADEAEADVIGLEMMARAGFDPRQSIQLWRNMSAQSGGAPPEFMSTHPSDQSRIKGLSAKMDGALALYQQAQAQGRNPQCSP